jgi:hypothetical protein
MLTRPHTHNEYMPVRAADKPDIQTLGLVNRLAPRKHRRNLLMFCMGHLTPVQRFVDQGLPSLGCSWARWLTL